MMRKIGLFLLSLWLLFVLVIIITIDIPLCFSDSCEFPEIKTLIRNNIIPIISFIALILGTLSYYNFVFKLKGTKELSFKIIEIENIDYEHLTFLTTYIVPLVTFNFLETRYQIVFFILLLVIGAIYIRTDLFYANPTLSILKFRIYKVTGEFRDKSIRKNKVLLTRQDLSKNDRVKYIKLDDRIYFAQKEGTNE